MMTTTNCEQRRGCTCDISSLGCLLKNQFATVRLSVFTGAYRLRLVSINELT